MRAGQLHRAELAHDRSRVIAQLFLPGEEESAAPHTRAAEIVARVMALPAAAVERLAAELIGTFEVRHADARAVFEAHADAVGSRLRTPLGELSEARRTVLGASFTSEFAVEGAALCNPSAVAHPDQTCLAPGALRVAVAVRCIGEGHISSIGFVEAVIGADRTWTFAPRASPLSRPRLAHAAWSLDHFRASLDLEGFFDEVASAVMGRLGAIFTAGDLEDALADLPMSLTARSDGARQAEVLRALVNSSYRAQFDADSLLSQRTLMPVADEENHGMEDARFVRFTDADGAVDYRATYTAYNGREIAPRLLTSPDLRGFTVHRLAGDAARNKGMALFPRLIGGRHLALGRTNGENITLARSDDGLSWSEDGLLCAPREPWEIIQTGNCGSPIETESGWIVLIHGVGPLRTYSLGALLLDLEDPGRIIARTSMPILEPEGELSEGYVPHVVYSCGGIVHDGVLWVPIGIGDARIGVFSVGVDELLEQMESGPA
jgi:predicted GH43/DUF377 family glycosyl hydrolase